MSKTTTGLCKYCGQEFAKSEMGTHLNECKDREAAMAPKAGQQACEYVQLLIYGTYLPEYWLIVDVRDNVTLATLDRFLREIWLECCGHLSAFTINGVRYEVEVDDWIDGPPAESMDLTVKKAFEGVEVASYEYDFGSTTDLTIEVQGWHIGRRLRAPITVLSRNIPPELKCSNCGAPAEWVNPEEAWDGLDEAVFCSDCLKKAAREEYGEDFDEDEDESYIFEEYLHVCNSPRCGICAYEGSTRYPEVFVPDKKRRSSRKIAAKKA